MDDFQLRYEERDSYLYVKGTGVRKNLQAIYESTRELAQIIEKTHSRFVLLDYTELVTTVSNTDVFNITRIYENAAPILYSLCISIIINPNELEMEKFWEDICLRRGFDFKIFTDDQDAVNWLLKEAAASN